MHSFPLYRGVGLLQYLLLVALLRPQGASLILHSVQLLTPPLPEVVKNVHVSICYIEASYSNNLSHSLQRWEEMADFF